MWGALLTIIGLVAGAAGLVSAHISQPASPGIAVGAGYAGSAACAACHAKETEAWRGSHHAHAMQPARAATVLGAFDGAWHADRGASVRFFRTTDSYVAETGGATYAVRGTFGVYPLQQYLAAFPGGRLQILPLAWDARPREQGGQRWFNPVGPDAPAWTSRDETWNFMCADCHATGVVRGYDLATDTYATRLSEPGVTCESCHGPGAAHVAWARAGPGGASGPSIVSVPRVGGAWGDYDPATGIRHWQGVARGGAELDLCAPCHARRRPIVATPRVGAPFLDGYDPELLTTDLYQADGQLSDEAFEWGSFMQSRMHETGVTCSDCHDAHGLTRRAEGNALCAQCHAPEKFDVAAHTHHAEHSAGAVCTACHMPQHTYMGVHVRHDHGFRVPRPDLDTAYGTSDACTDCHAGRAAGWAALAIRRWLGHAPQKGGQQASLAAARSDPEAARRAASDNALAPIVRATLLAGMGGDLADAPALRAAAASPDPLLRLSAARAQGPASAGRGLLEDHFRAVRITASRQHAGDPDAARGLREWQDAEWVASDRPESHVNLGALFAETGAMVDAAAAYKTALRLDPAYVPALVDLGDLARALGDEHAAESLFRRAVTAGPQDATAWYALGLSLVRQQRKGEAQGAMAKAHALGMQ